MYSTACEQVYSMHRSARLPWKIFARYEELHAFDTRVSRLLTHATMLASYATQDFYVLTCLPTQNKLPVHANLLQILSRNIYLHAFHYNASELAMTAALSGSNHKKLPRLYSHDFKQYVLFTAPAWLHLLEICSEILVKFFWMDRRLYKQPRRGL